MKTPARTFAALLFALLLAVSAHAQAAAAAPPQDPAERAFNEGNDLMERRKYAEALAKYREALKHAPDEPSVLYNASTASLLAKDFASAAELLKKLVRLEPEDWQVRAKLIQAHQALGDTAARDAERADLLALRKRGGGENKEEPQLSLSRQEVFCRERFEVAGRRGMAFEHFELKGPRALRYVFVVLKEDEDAEDFRISLGSYDMTNAIWRETTKPTPKEGERLFHLDGYFPGGGHATYGMYPREPSYDEVRRIVFGILEGKNKPVSSSTVGRPPAKQDEPKKRQPR